MIKKYKPIEYEYRKKTISEADLEIYRPLDAVEYIIDNGPVTNEEKTDFIDAEKFIHFLSSEEVEILLLQYLGFKHKEITEILGCSMSKYYKTFNEIKHQASIFKSIKK